MQSLVARLRSLHAAVEAACVCSSIHQQPLVHSLKGASRRTYSAQQERPSASDPFGAPPQLPQRRVVVTGIGIVSPLAVGTAKSWQRLSQGHTAVRRLQALDLPEVIRSALCETRGCLNKIPTFLKSLPTLKDCSKPQL